MSVAWVKSLTFDCADALVLARFWAAALGGTPAPGGTAGKARVDAPGWGGPTLWFQRVPEPGTAKNRLHFDLRAPGGDVPAEVRRLTGLGATVVTPGELTVMEDPEGNIFCVEE